MQQEHFFQSFFGPQAGPQPQQIVPEHISYNEIVNEIANNWEYVLILMNKANKGTLQQVDILEQTWYNFIVSQNVNIFYYKDADDFLIKFTKATPALT